MITFVPHSTLNALEMPEAGSYSQSMAPSPIKGPVLRPDTRSTSPISDMDLDDSHCMDLVVLKRADPLRHKSAAAAYHCLMSGRFAAAHNGLVFIPTFTTHKQMQIEGNPELSRFCDDGAYTPEELEEAKSFLSCK